MINIKDLKKGDIVRDIRYNHQQISQFSHVYGKVEYTEDNYMVWARWSNSLDNIKKKIYNDGGFSLWLDIGSLELITIKPKEIKQFGIVNFIKKYY